jgi:hypothetical protein
VVLAGLIAGFIVWLLTEFLPHHIHIIIHFT